MGYVTRNVSVGHPDFGKSFPCVCQRDLIADRRNTRLRALSNLDAVSDKTFDAFEVDLPNLSDEQRAVLRSSVDLARRYAESPQGWLLLQGNFGSGKTHLAAAIANYRFEAGDFVIFVTAPDFLDHLRSTFGPTSEVPYDDLFEQVRGVPLLILDDLGAESSTPWAQEKLYQLINHRYVNRLCTVITTNSVLEDLDPRVRSRLVDWHLARSVNMLLPDYRRKDAAAEPNLLADLSLYGHMTFETFDPRRNLPDDERRNLADAFETASNYARDPQGWLVFIGEHGCGKTHLAASIANYRQALGDTVILVTAPDLLDYLRASFSAAAANTFGKRLNDIRSASLLVIDQLDLNNASSWSLEKIRQIVDHRYLAKLPTVFTTVQAFAELDPLVRSRLLDDRFCHAFAILAPDYRGGRRVR